MRVATKAVGVMTVVCSVVLAGLASNVAPPPSAPPRAGNPFIISGPVAEDWSEKILPHLRRSGSPMGRQEAGALLEAVEASAARFGLDPMVVLAVIEVESRFDPRAVSRVGALGLMQLQIETAREVAAHLDIPWTSDDLLFDPEVNVLLGTCYLRRLLDRFGDQDAALAAFNIGPGRIQGRLVRSKRFSLRYADRVLDAFFHLRSRALA